VEIYVGLLDDVPLAEAYDVVVIMGVLEYVGHGSPDASIYAGFLERAASLLRPGGTLVLGIENRLGVKYLVGAPEDHLGRAFETLEGYDEASVARTFSRRELEGLLLGCGLEVTTLGLFPNYKLARTIFHDDIFEIAPHLATSIPSFPSPDWGDNGTRVASEARAWRTLVDAGLGTQTTNSLLVLGSAARSGQCAGRTRCSRPSTHPPRAEPCTASRPGSLARAAISRSLAGGSRTVLSQRASWSRADR